VSKTKVGTWDTLRLHPMTLMRMVIDGRATVIGKDKRGRKIYEIKEIGNGQKALATTKRPR